MLKPFGILFTPSLMRSQMSQLDHKHSTSNSIREDVIPPPFTRRPSWELFLEAKAINCCA